ncbi:MAG TPA: hypothetical protein VGO47_00870 [Chlamydiales bacterium]|nr:hypothetical protein [Chlamydiales bacterium]
MIFSRIEKVALTKMISYLNTGALQSLQKLFVGSFANFKNHEVANNGSKGKEKVKHHQAKTKYLDIIATQMEYILERLQQLFTAEECESMQLDLIMIEHTLYK